MSNNDKLDLGGAERGLSRHGLASSVAGGNTGRCANLSCRQLSSNLVNGYCPICASGQGPAPITGGRPIPTGHGFHLTAPTANCSGGVCSVPGTAEEADGKCGDACQCGGNCACSK